MSLLSVPAVSGDVPAGQPRRPGRAWPPRLLALLTLAVSAAFLAWRLDGTVDLSVWWVSVPLVALEAYGLLSLALFVLTTWSPGDGTPLPEPVSTPPGRVAVLVPTYNEPLEVLLPTLAAAAGMHVEHETWVLDDGVRPWVRELAEGLGVRYLARTDRSHAKAGNLNHALGVVGADLVAVLDADHVPSPRFLAATLGHFADPGVALVQTPQEFYNEDSFEHVAPSRLARWLPRRLRGPGRTFSEQALFYRVLQPSRNRWNAAFWCGTNAVLRVEALRSVGGLAVDSVTEDIHTTIRLHRAGWRTVYHDEVLARGLAAADGPQYLSQRVRWGTGAMQVLRRENPLTGPGLTLAQRLCYAATLLGWFEAWRTLAYVLLPVVVLTTGVSPVRGSALTYAALFVPTLLLQQLCLAVLGRGCTRPLAALLFEFVRLPAGLLATVSGLTSREIPFKVTAKGRLGTDRRAAPVPLLHVALAVAAAAALAWWACVALGWAPVRYRSAPVADAAAGWLVLDLLLVLAAAARVRSPRFATERRAAVRVPVSPPATTDGGPCTVVDLSVTGARLDLPGVAGPGGLLALQLPGAVVELAFLVVGSRPHAGGQRCTVEFVPGQARALATLAPYLFRPTADADQPLPAPVPAVTARAREVAA